MKKTICCWKKGSFKLISCCRFLCRCSDKNQDRPSVCSKKQGMHIGKPDAWPYCHCWKLRAISYKIIKILCLSVLNDSHPWCIRWAYSLFFFSSKQTKIIIITTIRYERALFANIYSLIHWVKWRRLPHLRSVFPTIIFIFKEKRYPFMGSNSLRRVFCLLYKKGSTLKGKNLGANSFLLK